MEEKGIIHCDLAARNVLAFLRTDGSTVFKVSDFDRSATHPISFAEACHQVARGLPVRWMAPEILLDQVFTGKGDVWSFGVVLWEAASMGDVPYKNLSNNEVVEHICQGNVLDKPDSMEHTMYEVVTKCWEQSDRRPKFKELKDGIFSELSDQDVFNDDVYISPNVKKVNLCSKISQKLETLHISM